MKDRQASDGLAAHPRRAARFWWGWALALALGGFVVVLATLPPFVGSDGRLLLMEGFSAVCHQIPERSPQVGGVPFAVCHRCYGVYWGLPIAAVVFLFMGRWEEVLGRHAPKILLFSLIPPALDWLLGVLGFWHNTPLSRMVTGGVFGLVAGYYLARACTHLFGVPASSTHAAAPAPTGSNAGGR